MQRQPSKILCVGSEMDLLHIRCEVLSKSGYEARATTLGEAERILRREQFDLVIVSAYLSEPAKTEILALIGNRMPVLELHTTTFARDLLAQVEQKLTRGEMLA